MSDKESMPVRTLTEEMFNEPQFQHLAGFLELVKRGSPWEVPTERLLRLNGDSRRGSQLNSHIQSLLHGRGLICTPPIESADYYGTIVVSDPRDATVKREALVALPISVFQDNEPRLMYAGPEMAAKKVETLMIADDFSQIPVLSSDRRNLCGVATWRTLARYRGDLAKAKAKDVMERGFHVAASSDDFLGLVGAIIGNEFLLYRDPDGAVSGIVTSSDLAQAFNDLPGVYIQIGEIEDRLRILLGRSPIPVLKKYLNLKFGAWKNCRGATDIMFVEYIARPK